MHQKYETHEKLDRLDSREIQLPETAYIHDVESRVFQAIVLQVLSRVEGIALLEGTLIDTLLGRDGGERMKGIYIEQDQNKQSLQIRIEINIKYGVSIPQKAEEIQACVVEEVIKFTGLHVSCVHVVFKNLVLPSSNKGQEDAGIVSYAGLDDAR